MNIKSKVAVVTGGTQGIGAATALMLAKAGADIFLVARNQPVTIHKEIISKGVRCYVVIADLSDQNACLVAVQEIVKVSRRIDILVHCAGSAAPGGLMSGASDVWYKAFDIHVHSTFHLCHAIVPVMKQNGGGSIVVISSAAGKRGVKNALAYSTVKGALFQFTRSLAFEVAPDNIRVNSVSPGVIRTRFQDHLSAEQIKNNIDNRIPLRREGTPQDVAAVILMLIENGFITGEDVSIDGGMTMRMV